MKKKAQILGLLGLGNRTTLFYIDQLNQLYHNIYKGYHTCPFKMYNANFNNFNPYLPDQFRILETALSTALNQLLALEVDFILLPNITLHETFDRLLYSIPTFHPVSLTAQALMETKQQQAVVFGSLYTMEANYLKAAFQQQGVELIEPKVKDKLFIDYFRKQVYIGKETIKESQQFHTLKMVYAKQFSVVIACTELSAGALQQENNVYDMSVLQIQAAVNALL